MRPVLVRSLPCTTQADPPAPWGSRGAGPLPPLLWDKVNSQGAALTSCSQLSPLFSSALIQIRGKRPLVISRSTFPSQGQYSGHWLGDNRSQWKDMYYSIPGGCHGLHADPPSTRTPSSVKLSACLETSPKLPAPC